MKIFSAFIITLASLIFSFSRHDNYKFELYFSTYNHAEDSVVLTYNISGNSLTVSTNERFFEGKENIIYTGQISNEVILKMQSLKLEALEDNYDNECIMLTSGDEYFIGLTDGKKLKRIHLHHYYKEEIEQLVELINSVLPKEYHIDYVGKDDCP